MANEPVSQEQNIEKEHRFLPRFIGLVSGVIGGIVTGRILLKKAMHKWVEQKLHYGKDHDVLAAFNEIEKELGDTSTIPHDAKRKHMEEMKETLKKIEDKALTKKAEKLKLEEAKGEAEVKKKLDVSLLEIKRDGGDAKRLLEEKENFKPLFKRAKGIAEQKVNSNFDYFYGRDKGKIVNEEIMDRMGLRLRMVEGRRWIFIGGAVALGAIGYTGYKIADLIMNGDSSKHRQALINRTNSQKNNNSSGNVII